MTINEEITYKSGSITDGMISNNVPAEICDTYYQGFIEGGRFGAKRTIGKIIELLNDCVHDNEVCFHEDYIEEIRILLENEL